MAKDFYKILGVEKSATAEEIKKAYKKMAIKYHPDRNPGDKDAEEKFKEAAEAYSVLSDPEKRQRYDQFGEAGLEGQGGFGGFGQGGFSMNDIFEQFGDLFEEHFGGGFGFGGNRARRGPSVIKGSDLRMKVRLSLEEAAKGTVKKFRVKKDVLCTECHGSGCADGSQPETCPHCHGSGVVITTQRTMLGMMQTQNVCPNCHGEGKIIKNKCSHCHGEGVTKGEEIVEVSIPAGVAEGMVVTAHGKGNAAPRGGIAGDILVFIEEEPHPDFIRDQYDLIYNLVLTVSQASLGDTVEIPTIDGKARLNIKAGTQPGTSLRLRGKGMPILQSNGSSSGRGDQIVNISVYVPEDLSKSQREAFEKMKDDKELKPTQRVKDSILRTFRRYF